MRFVCILNKNNYIKLKTNKQSPYHAWRDKESPLLRIISRSDDIWGKQIIIEPKIKHEKTYPSKLIFNCSILQTIQEDTLLLTNLVRKTHAAKFINSQVNEFVSFQAPPVAFYALPIDVDKKDEISVDYCQWVTYSFYKAPIVKSKCK